VRKQLIEFAAAAAAARLSERCREEGQIHRRTSHPSRPCSDAQQRRASSGIHLVTVDAASAELGISYEGVINSQDNAAQ
jgi:hypothetical protein